jgi:hypothetical protein
MLTDPQVQTHIDAMVTHTYPMTQAQEALQIGLTRQCGKIYLHPQE